MSNAKDNISIQDKTSITKDLAFPGSNGVKTCCCRLATLPLIAWKPQIIDKNLQPCYKSLCFLTLQGLSPYEKKKYVWKMLYIYMLGYDVDFGHMETVSLISAPKYPEKQVKHVVMLSLVIAFFLKIFVSVVS